MVNTNSLTLPPLPDGVKSARVPSWNVNNLLHRSCPVCGLDETATWVIRADRLRIARCLNCSMIYLPDTPSLTDIDEFYNAYGNFKGFQGRHLSKTNWFIRSFFNPFVNILNSSGGLSGKRLLDVGCSYGDFLQLVKRRGAKIQGVELDGHALAHLKSVDIPASNQMPVNQQFDIVCAFQILEHLVDPDDFIAKLSDLLVEDGRLLLTLPNGGEAEQIGSSWIGFRVDYEHLNYFSSRSLSALLIKNNLYVENVWTYSHPGVSRVSVEPNRMLSKLNRMINIYLEREPDVIKGNFVLAVMARKVN